MPAKKKSYTLIVVPDHAQAQVRRYHIQRNFLLQLSMGLVLLVGFAIGSGVHYFAVARDAAENRILRDENLTLRGQLKSIRERIEHIGATLDRVERFDQKLRALVDAGGHVGWYAQPKTQLKNPGHGQHYKTLIADGERAIVGGRNIGESYFKTWTDFDVELTSSPAKVEQDGTRKYRLTVAKELVGKIGAGGPELFLKSFNGDIVLRQAGASK